MGAAAEAQQPAGIPRIGYIEAGSATGSGNPLEAFRQGLRELGYIEGQNIIIEYRWAEGRAERLPELAAQLVRLQVKVIVATGEQVILAAKQATGTIPIVMTAVGDPVGRGFVASLARPGGNITGVSNMAVELTGKWVELLKEIVPTLSQVAVLKNPANRTHAFFWREAQTAAQTLRVKAQAFDVQGPDGFEGAFAAISQERPGGLLVLPDPMTIGQRARIADFAAKQRLPSIYTFRQHVEAGGLISYGPSLQANFRRAAAYVDKILKGAKPADLPVEQPMRFELVVNTHICII